MPVPSSMQDLAQLAGSNSPPGTEAIGNSLDNYIRAGFAITRSTNALSSATIASASTTDLATSDAESVQVTGSATITSLGTGFNGCRREVRFTGTPTLVHGSNLVLPGAVNITVQAGECLAFRCVGSGQWIMTARARTDVVGTLGYTPVNKAGDGMTGALTIAVAANEYLFSTRSGFSFAHVNLGNGQHGLFDSTAGANAWLYSTASGGGHVFRGAGTFTSNVTTQGVYAAQRSDSNFAYSWQTAAAASRGGLWVRSDGFSIVNLLAPGGFQELLFNNNGNLQWTGGFNLGNGFTVTKFSVSSSAPGVLAQGEIYFQTT